MAVLAEYTMFYERMDGEKKRTQAKDPPQKKRYTTKDHYIISKTILKEIQSYFKKA